MGCVGFDVAQGCYVFSCYLHLVFIENLVSFFICLPLHFMASPDVNAASFIATLWSDDCSDYSDGDTSDGDFSDSGDDVFFPGNG